MQVAAVVPSLREDLRLYPTAANRNGSPAWVIQDPITNRFYRIGWVEYECLLRWAGTHEHIAKQVSQQTALELEAQTVSAFQEFLMQNHLVRPDAEAIQRIKQQAHAKGWRTWRWWVKNYLFIRVPVVRPNRFLTALLPWVEPLFTKTALGFVLALTLAGLLMVFQQWDMFTHSVVDLFSPAGLIGFALALMISKLLHELGHALAAGRQGVRVAHMGVAFLVMWPMLYTDTGESWRLRASRQRLAISIAGVSVELALAGIATFLWAILNDGLWREAMLYLATTGWILSLAINVSPFMRFDGYFILSDSLNFPNLHERAGALARHQLRRWVLSLDEPAPEHFSKTQSRALCAFAYVTWLYRLGVFLAIAWMVYTFFFKVLGLILFVVEIVWFVWRPVWSELMEWKKRWPQVKRRRKMLLMGVVIAGVLLSALPWRTHVSAPALLYAEREQFIYAPFSAQLSFLQPTGNVAQGATLVQLSSPDLLSHQQRTRALESGIEQRLQGLMGDQYGSQTQQSLIQQLAEQQAEQLALQAESQRLTITAPFAGYWVDVPFELHAESWINEKTPIGVVIDANSAVIDAYVTQHEVAYLRVGDRAKFYTPTQWQPLSATVVDVDATRVQRQLPQVLDAQHGGQIVTHQRESDQEFLPVQSRYRVRLKMDAPMPPQERVGTVRIQGERRSWLWDKTLALVSLLVRESGF